MSIKAIFQQAKALSKALAWARIWKEAAKEKRWRLVLCTEAAANRKELLRRVEWCKWDGVDFVSYKCPECGNYKQQGHEAGCELAKALVSEQSEEELGDD